jgi:DNA-binding PadR family transcriptional regulator
MSEFTLNQTLTTPAFYVLLAVANRVLHGYGIRDQVAHDSDGLLILAMGTVYPLLDRLVRERLLERVEVTDGLTEGPKIVCRYRITSLGRRRLESEIRRLERVTIQARYKLGQRLFGA